MPVPAYPPLPTYAPADGCVYAWILKAAQRVREERQGLDHGRWLERESEKRAARRTNP